MIIQKNNKTFRCGPGFSEMFFILGLSTFVVEFGIVFGAFVSFFFFVLKNDLENFRSEKTIIQTKCSKCQASILQFFDLFSLILHKDLQFVS